MVRSRFDHDAAHPSYVTGMPAGEPVFPLPKQGAEMLRGDLEAANIPYVDDLGLVFDFHALRAQMATLLDASGVSPRTVQRLMWHSSLALTDRYTRPRVVDLDNAARTLPDLRTSPTPQTPETLAATGTDGE